MTSLRKTMTTWTMTVMLWTRTTTGTTMRSVALPTTCQTVPVGMGEDVLAPSEGTEDAGCLRSHPALPWIAERVGVLPHRLLRLHLHFHRFLPVWMVRASLPRSCLLRQVQCMLGCLAGRSVC